MAVYLPNPSTAMLKIPPHITLVQRPTRRNARIPTGTSCQITLNEAQSMPGTSTVLVSGENIPKPTNSKVALATVVIIVRLEILAPILAPTKRPISIINQ